MALSMLFTVIVAALLINTLCYCSASNVYCVTPTVASCPSCPDNSTHCTTLSEYAQEAELYFTSNTTIVFLPGDHVLDRNITVANVSRLTMRGESSSDNYTATIVCSGPYGLIFTNMMKFKMQSLAFTKCSRMYTFPLNVLNSIITSTFRVPFTPTLPFIAKHALLLQSTQYAELVNCSFHDNIGTALVVISSSITAENNDFTHNYCEPSKCDMFGGGIVTVNSSLTFIGNTTFIGNIGIVAGAGIFTFNSALNSTGNFHFESNSNIGSITLPVVDNLAVGAMFAHTSSLHFNGTNNFANNSAQSQNIEGYGGAICVVGDTSLSFTGTNNFINNSAQSERFSQGGAIFAFINISLSFTGTNNFINNSVNTEQSNNSAQSEGVGYGGAIIAFNNVTLSFTGTSNFEQNSATAGGAIIAYNNVTLSFTGTINFEQNSATIGGVIFAYNNVTLSFTGTSNFEQNSATIGGVIYAYINNVTLSFTGTSNFEQNSATIGGVIYACINCMLSITGTSNFSSNSASQGGAIFLASDNSMTFDGNISFTNNGNSTNETSYGGGMYLNNSTFSIMPDTTVYWENNSASFGGAIYVFDQTNPLSFCPQIDNTNTIECFYQLPGWDFSHNTRLVFRNNSAKVVGGTLYGGAIDNCRLTGLDWYRSGDVFDKIFDIEYDHNNSEVYFNPLHICPCQDNHPNCDYPSIYKTVYPGETFQVSVVASGRQNTLISAEVRSHIQGNNGELQKSQYSQETNSYCTPLNFTMFSLSNSVLLQLNEVGACGTFGYILNIHLTVNQTCPPGFNISEMTESCVCEKRLQRFTNSCNITSGKITRESGQQFWVRYVHENESQGLILHQLCPFDYCTSGRVDFSLNNTDIQCAHNRSGLLCGACKTNYSLVLGTSYCKKCTNSHLALLVLFAVMGVALVILLFVCKLTVATGILSGLLFYANIVGVNHTIFLPVESTNAILVFIAWLNLDFGIEICFYDGMDAYTQTWLQFVFPAYLWVIVGLVIVVSNCSHRLAKLLGNNPVSVLATLILLSYTKILRTLIAAINFTHLEYPTHNSTVWLYDANIDYLSATHIPLFIVAMLIFLFLFLPYTLLLFFGQWLQAISHLKLFSWVNKLKPFMDSYHAPYKAKHRYWPGLLLVLRFVFFLVLAIEFSPQQDRTNINLLSILVVAGILQLWAWISGGVYRNWCLNGLEGSFVLNLTILAGATMYTRFLNRSGDQSSQHAVGYTSVSIALITFIAILAYHIFQQVRNTKLWKKVPKLNLKLNKLNLKQAVNDLINYPEDPCEATPNTTVTHTEIDMRELRSPLNLVNTK